MSRSCTPRFTLLELMVVVAVLATLAAIAIPQFARYQYQAKRTEVATVMDGLQTAEAAYAMTFDRFHSGGVFTFHPRAEAQLDKLAVPWRSPVPPPTEMDAIGYEPDGAVRCAYGMHQLAGSFIIQGSCDVDDDGVVYRRYATSPLTGAIAWDAFTMPADADDIF